MKRSLFFITLILSLLLAACSTPTAETPAVQITPTTGTTSEVQSEALVRQDDQGAVIVTVTPANLTDPSETIDFTVSMETHTVELDMDLVALSSLTTDTGITVSPAGWEGNRGGHHVEGTLSFPASQDGKSVRAGAKTLTLTIQNVDAPERVFTWEISQ